MYGKKLKHIILTVGKISDGYSDFTNYNPSLITLHQISTWNLDQHNDAQE